MPDWRRRIARTERAGLLRGFDIRRRRHPRRFQFGDARDHALQARPVAGGVAGGGWFLGAVLLLLYTWVNILRSTTRIDEQGLSQTWVWNKHMELRELAYGKLIRVRGLEWLIAPRLYVRTLMGKFAVFYATSPEMIAEFERLVKELKAFREMR